MFHFLKTIENDVGKAKNVVTKTASKGLNFLADTTKEIASAPAAIIHNPVQAAKTTVKTIAEPFEDIAKHTENTVKQLAKPAASSADRQKLIDNQTAASKNPEYKNAIKGLDQHGNTVQGVNEAQHMAAQGSSAADIRTHLQKDAAAKAKQDAKAVGDIAQVAATVTGGKTIKDIAEVGKSEKALSTADKLKTAITTGKRVAKEGATAGAENSIGTQLSDNGKVNIRQTLKDTLTGGALATGGAVGSDLAKTGIETIADHSTPLNEGGYIKIGKDTPDNIVKKVFHNQTEDNALYHGTRIQSALDILNSGGIKANTSKFERTLNDDKTNRYVSLSRQRNSGFFNGKNSDVKFVVDGEKVGKTQPYVDGELKPSDHTNPYGFEAEQRTKKDVPLSAIKRIEGGSLLEPEEEKQLRELAAKHNIPFVAFDDTKGMRDTIEKSNNSKVDQKKFTNALTGNRQKELDDMEAAGANTKAAETSPINKFKAAITSPTEPGYTPPKTGAQVLNESLPKKAQLTPQVTQLLEDTGKAVPKASKTPILEGFRDPQSVAGRYLGKTGSDIVYESSQAAKKRSDIQDAANPLVTDVEKNAKGLSKTTAGQPEVRRRLNQALEDRANADSYLKTPQEKKTYESLQKAYDFGKQLLEEHGIGTLENYSPRIARRNAQDASEGLDYTLNKAFSNKTDSAFTKKRANEEPAIDLAEDPVAALRGYFSSISKQLAYEPLMKSLPERFKGVNPIHTINHEDKELGKAYLQKHFKNLLQPDVPTGGFFGEKFQNKLINQTYKSSLKFKPSFIITNPTQRFAARSQVSPEAIKLSKQIDPEDLKSLHGGLTSGRSTISSDLTSSAESVSGKQSKTDILHEKLSGEQGNVVRAFNLGASQHIASSPLYKAAIKAGKSSKEAAKVALADPETRENAIRDGNVLTNVTQFGANVANKPQVLAEGGTTAVIPLSKKWFQQYKRFQLGTTQLLGNVTDPKTARALDIMRRGDPKQTQLVDYLKAAKTLQGAVKEARKTVKAGETDVTHADLNGAEEALNRSIKVLNKQIKNASQIRSGRTAKNLALMWAAASTVQFLFSGAANPSKAIQYGSPVSAPTKSDNPLTAVAPSVPTSTYSKLPLGLSAKKALNFLPVVGPILNRASDAEKLIGALTGQNK